MKKLLSAILLVLSLFTLASCDLDEIFSDLTKDEYYIDYYIDNKFIEFEPVYDGDNIILDLDDIYLVDEDCYLSEYIEEIETEYIKFDYWYTDSSYTTKATADMVVTKDISLYGRIVDNTPKEPEPITYTVSYVLNGHGDSITQASGLTALPNTLPTPKEDGYTFEGWYLDNEFKTKAAAGASISQNITLYAKWTKIEEQNPTPDTPVTPEPEEPVETGIVDNIVYEDFQIHFLELGNEYTGDSTYIKVGNIDILIDAGSRKNSAAAIKEYVDEYCTDGKLEYVIGTHGDQDHIAGFVGNSSGSTRTGILYQYEIGTIITASLSNKTTQIYEDYLTAIELCQDNGAKVYDAGSCYNNEGGAQRVYELADNITMEILYNYYYFNESDDENNYSVCVMFNYNDNHFMLTGDLELEGEEEMAKYYDGSTAEKTLPHVDLFKAGHHGSKTSTNECLLEKITPEIVCVCCCAGSTEYTANYNNIFPTQDMITRVAEYTDRLYVTSVFNEKTKEFESLNGNIVISCNGYAVGVSATNNITKLKDSTWFNETIYVDSEGNICSGKGKEDFFISTSPGVTAVKRRIWPSA